MKAGYFVTGTDTGVGKTLISSALVHGFANRGYNAIGMKPVAAGCIRQGNQLLSEDVAQLMAASNVAASLDLINPYAFEPAIAPHIAAEQAGVDIEIKIIEDAYRQLSGRADVVVVEGVGGFIVPLGARLDTADLAQELDLPVILVVGMRLGCLSHALLTAEGIQGRGLKLVGWVANQIDPNMSAYAENLQALQQRLPAPCLGIVSWAAVPDFKSAAAGLALEKLEV